MIRRVCPICDQVMKSAHYCRNCRSWVKHPYVREVNYYLNERHPEQETSCSYHEDAASGTNQPGQSRTRQSHPLTGQRHQKQPGGGQIMRPAGSRSAGRDSADRYSAGSRSADRDRIRVSWILITVIVVILFLGSCAGVSSMMVSSLLDAGGDYEIDLGAYDGEDCYEDGAGDGEYQVLEDEEAIARGQACTVSAHMPVTMSEIEEPILEILAERGISVEDTSCTSYNVDYGDGDCWYSTDYMFYLDDSWDQYVDVNCDTVTDDVHGIGISMNGEEKLSEVTGAVLVFLRKQGIINLEDDFLAGSLDDLAAAAESGGDFYVSKDRITVQGWPIYDGNYCVYISPEE